MNGKKMQTNGKVSMMKFYQDLEFMFKIVTFGKLLVMNHIRTMGAGWIIHMFALLHAVVALGCRLAGVEDELLLTILTMTMTLLVCLRKGLNIEFTAASIIIVNIIGYLLGNAGATLFALVLKSQYIIHALATTLTTEILGWSIVAFTKLLQSGSHEQKPISIQYIQWIIVAMVAVFAIRIGIIFMLASDIFAQGDMMRAISRILSNSFALIILLCINILYVRTIGRIHKGMKRGGRVLMLTLFIALSALVEATFCSIGIPFEVVVYSWMEFLHLFIASVIVQITIYCLVYMVNFALTARTRMNEEKEKKHVAQYRYQKLKRQLNPHFLFNSLNTLDCLVCEEKNGQASTYIHKLASVYRYMIRSEEEELVSLGEELTFVGMYIDLLKVRFPEGFDVTIEVPAEDQARFVLPCSIQLLIENATKHNTDSVENPLMIKVVSDGTRVKVSNNILPKVTSTPSTGLGQKYIRQQYLDLSGKEISIEKGEDTYSVTLPLL